MKLAPGLPYVSVIIHERLANWSRHLRPRLSEWPVRWFETRSLMALVHASAGAACPILVVGLDHRPIPALRDLDEILQAIPSALSLVIDPLIRPEVTTFARERGATMVLSGPVVPPQAERLLERWIQIAISRSKSEGWAASNDPRPEFWEQDIESIGSSPA